ncbi:MAG: DUF4255 domain-containing protein [Bacteroidia bacterium]|nr:DUF4255 domain-containing protein [Bacteroidia bacterium]
MIYEVLQAISDELNDHLKYRFNETEDIIVLSNLMDLSGSKALQTDNQVHMMLVRMEEDKTINRSGGYHGSTAEGNARLFNAYVLFAANFSGKQYPQGLNYISRILEYFVAHPTLLPSDLPDLPITIDSLVVELNSLEERENSNLWGAIGSKLMPYLYYKLNYIPIYKESGFAKSAPSVSGLNPNAGGL